MPVNPRTQDAYVHEFLDTVHETNIARLYKQEYFIQSSAAGELAGFYGQPRERLLLEAPLVRDVGMGIRSSGAYAMDLAVFDGPRTPRGSGTPVIGAPIKLSKDDHQELIAIFKRCRGLLDRESCGSDHRNCLWIRQNLTVQHLWVRSQNESDLFKVQRAGDGGFDLDGPRPRSERDDVLSRLDWS